MWNLLNFLSHSHLISGIIGARYLPHWVVWTGVGKHARNSFADAYLYRQRNFRSPSLSSVEPISYYSTNRAGFILCLFSAINLYSWCILITVSLICLLIVKLWLLFATGSLRIKPFFHLFPDPGWMFLKGFRVGLCTWESYHVLKIKLSWHYPKNTASSPAGWFCFRHSILFNLLDWTIFRFPFSLFVWTVFRFIAEIANYKQLLFLFTFSYALNRGLESKALQIVSAHSGWQFPFLTSKNCVHPNLVST